MSTIAGQRPSERKTSRGGETTEWAQKHGRKTGVNKPKERPDIRERTERPRISGLLLVTLSGVYIERESSDLIVELLPGR